MQLKSDPILYGLYAVCILAATALLWKGVLRWDEVAPFFAGVLLPSPVGRKEGNP